LVLAWLDENFGLGIGSKNGMYGLGWPQTNRRRKMGKQAVGQPDMPVSPIRAKAMLWSARFFTLRFLLVGWAWLLGSRIYWNLEGGWAAARMAFLRSN
jgi:hypothetical protein